MISARIRPRPPLRFIALLRTATSDSAALAKQRSAIAGLAQREGFVCVDEIVLDGLSGTDKPLLHLLKRKATYDDFDAVVAADPSRLTRKGWIGFEHIRASFDARGIVVRFASDEPSGLIDAIRRASAASWSHEHSVATRSGIMDGLRGSTVVHASRTPVGVDRLYRDNDGRALYRASSDGRGGFLVLDPKTEAIWMHFPACKARTGLRWRSLRASFVPGERQKVELVRRLFVERFQYNRSPDGISRLLNSTHVAAPNHLPWTRHMVQQFLANTVYLGVGITHRTSRQPYMLTTPVRPIRRRTPANEWIVVKYRDIGDAFVPAELRHRVAEWQAKRLSRASGDAVVTPELLKILME